VASVDIEQFRRISTGVTLLKLWLRVKCCHHAIPQKYNHPKPSSSTYYNKLYDEERERLKCTTQKLALSFSIGMAIELMQQGVYKYGSSALHVAVVTMAPSLGSWLMFRGFPLPLLANSRIVCEI
jgi:hypothetical protein